MLEISFAQRSPDLGHNGAYDTDPYKALTKCSLNSTWDPTTNVADVVQLVQCDCNHPQNTFWDPSAMAESSAFVDAAIEQMCNTLQSSHLGRNIPGLDIQHNYSASALYQRPGSNGDNHCAQYPQNCQNALATVTFHRGLGSPPSPPTYRVFTSSVCQSSLKAAAQGW